jgi:hypothetical protein
VSGKEKRYGGWLVAEMVVAFSLLGILIGCLAVSLHGVGKLNRYQLLRQSCIAAAESQLDSLAVTGRAIPEEDFARIWPGLSVSIEKSDGADKWEQLRLVEVTVTGESSGRRVKVRLARYISRDIVLPREEKGEALIKQGDLDA